MTHSRISTRTRLREGMERKHRWGDWLVWIIMAALFITVLWWSFARDRVFPSHAGDNVGEVEEEETAALRPLNLRDGNARRLGSPPADAP